MTTNLASRYATKPDVSVRKNRDRQHHLPRSGPRAKRLRQWGFNCLRLAEEFAARDDPWNIDMESVGEKMISGSFRVTDIRPRPSRTVILPFYSGSWFTESPFRPLQPAGLEGLRLENVTFGYHTLIRDPLIVYTLFVAEKEILWRLWE